MAALALISERRELLSKIFISRKVNPEGVYALRLFKDGRWQGVIIDDFLPCDGHKRLVFSQVILILSRANTKLDNFTQYTFFCKSLCAPVSPEAALGNAN